MGKEGIIAEHPTLKLKYIDPEMARIAQELKTALENDHKNKKHGDHEVAPESAVDSSKESEPSSDFKAPKLEEV